MARQTGTREPEENQDAVSAREEKRIKEFFENLAGILVEAYLNGEFGQSKKNEQKGKAVQKKAEYYKPDTLLPYGDKS